MPDDLRGRIAGEEFDRFRTAWTHFSLIGTIIFGQQPYLESSGIGLSLAAPRRPWYG